MKLFCRVLAGVCWAIGYAILLLSVPGFFLVDAAIWLKAKGDR